MALELADAVMMADGSAGLERGVESIGPRLEEDRLAILGPNQEREVERAASLVDVGAMTTDQLRRLSQGTADSRVNVVDSGPHPRHLHGVGGDVDSQQL